MRMPHHRVAMHMAVGPDWHRIVGVGMVAVVVHMGMFVSDCLMVLCFSQVNHYANSMSMPPINRPPPPERSPSANAARAPMNGANVNIEPVRAAPNARWAST